MALVGSGIGAPVYGAPRYYQVAVASANDLQLPRAGAGDRGLHLAPLIALAQKDRDARWTVKWSKAKPAADGSPRIDLAVRPSDTRTTSALTGATG